MKRASDVMMRPARNDGIEKTELIWLDRSHRRCAANKRANSQIIARFSGMSSAMLSALISEIIVSTLRIISRFRARLKNRDLNPANSLQCESH